MSIEWKVVISVLVALLVFKVLDVMFIDKMVSKIANFEEYENAD